MKTTRCYISAAVPRSSSKAGMTIDLGDVWSHYNPLTHIAYLNAKADILIC